MNFLYEEIKKVVTKSQQCQRNWDLSKTIPDEDIDLLAYAVTNCPSKQNVSYYDAYFITNRKTIEEIHNMTNGFIINRHGTTVTNSQTLANLLIAFTSCDLTIETNMHRNAEIDKIKFGIGSLEENASLDRDRNMAIGIAAGYVTTIASMLGYSTGCCACFDVTIKNIIGSSHNVELLIGVGVADSSKDRRLHHWDNSYIFPTKKKQEIKVFRI